MTFIKKKYLNNFVKVCTKQSKKKKNLTLHLLILLFNLKKAYFLLSPWTPETKLMALCSEIEGECFFIFSTETCLGETLVGNGGSLTVKVKALFFFVAVEQMVISSSLSQTRMTSMVHGGMWFQFSWDNRLFFLFFPPRKVISMLIQSKYLIRISISM